MQYISRDDKKGYKKLQVWVEAHKLVILIYQATEIFSRNELFGLTSQFRRAAVSVPSNIVEGHVKSSKKEFHHHLDFASGSLVEVEYYIELARDLGFISQKTYEELETQRALVGALLHGLILSLKR